MSKYAVVHGDNRGAGDVIVTLTDAEAMIWVERHLDADVHEQLFGLTPEAGSLQSAVHSRDDRGCDR